MKDWTFDIFEENLKFVLQSGKEVEGRVPDLRKEEKHYHLIEAGDKVTFRVVDNKNYQPVENAENPSFLVAYNKKYSTVEEYLTAEGLSRTLPEAETIADGIATYHDLPGYEERISEVGIHAIGLEKRLL